MIIKGTQWQRHLESNCHAEKFNFSKTKDWPKWIHGFERYLQASELNKKDDTLQINTFLLICNGTSSRRCSHFTEISSG